MALNPAEIGNDISGELKDLVSGDVEIAGKRIPKIAIIGGGAGVIVLLFLVSRRGGTGASNPFSIQSGQTSNGDTPASGFGTTDTPIGSGDIPIASDTGVAPTDSAIGDLTGAVDNYSNAYPVLPLPTDNYGGYADIPLYDAPVSYGGQNYVPDIPVSYGFESSPSTGSIPLMKGRDVPTIKPSNVKPSGGVVKPSSSTLAKLGTAQQKSSRVSGLVSKLGNAPKLSAAGSVKPSAVTGFNKHGVKPGKPNPVINMGAMVKNPTPIKQSQKQPAGIVSAVGKQNLAGSTAKQPKDYGNPLFNYLSGFTKAIPKPTIKSSPQAQQKQPPVYAKPKQTTIQQPKAQPKPQPKPYSSVPYNSNLLKVPKTPVKTLKKGK